MTELRHNDVWISYKNRKIVRHTLWPCLYSIADKVNWGREQQERGCFYYSICRWPSNWLENKAESETYTLSEIRESLEHKQWVRDITLERASPKSSETHECTHVCNPTHTAGNMGVNTIECMVIKVHKPEGVLLDANGTPASTKGTASIKFAGRAMGATTAKPKALEL